MWQELTLENLLKLKSKIYSTLQLITLEFSKKSNNVNLKHQCAKRINILWI